MSKGTCWIQGLGSRARVVGGSSGGRVRQSSMHIILSSLAGGSPANVEMHGEGLFNIGEARN